jgi:hypothetical protein
MIVSTCLNCGESEMLSSVDGSLQEWEERRRCGDTAEINPC